MLGDSALVITTTVGSEIVVVLSRADGRKHGDRALSASAVAVHTRDDCKNSSIHFVDTVVGYNL